MTTYQDLDWNSLDFVRQHLYRRLATLLTHALGRLTVAQHLAGNHELQAQCRRARQGVELALNTIKTWAALTQVKSGGAIQAEQRRLITPAGLPSWLVDTLNAQTAFKAEHSLPVVVHPEVFYESLILIAEIAAKVGHLKLLLLGDARSETSSVWLRAIFDPPESGGFAGLRGMVDRLDANNPAECDVLIQILVLESLCQINGACLKVQTNVDTGEQALAAQFMAASAEAAPCGDTSEMQRAADWEFTESQTVAASGTPPATLMVPPPGLHERIEPVLEPPSAVPEILPDTLIVPPPGLRERLAMIADNASDTLIVPPLDFRKRFNEALDAADAAEGGAPPDTLMVPPPNLHDRIGANAMPSPAASGEPPETLIVPPPGLHDLINAHTQEPPPAAPEDAVLTPPETAPAPPKSAGVEIVSAENASDQAITPPPELHRRWLARKLAGDPPPDETLPEDNGE